MSARVRINENDETTPEKSKRVRLKEPETETHHRSLTRAPVQQTLFGKPQLLPGEDPADYEKFVAHIRAAVKPFDIIFEMLIAEVASQQWEFLRWSRFKLALLKTWGLERLRDFLAKKLELQQYADHLTKAPYQNLPEGKAEDLAQSVAQACAGNKSDAVDKIKKALARSTDLDVEEFLDDARRLKAAELAQQYGRREPDAVTLVDQLLTDAGMSMDAFVADALAERWEDIDRVDGSTFVQRFDRLATIEQIDRLITNAENRRNSSLREIDRRHALLGETLRRTIEEVEDAEFEEIDTPHQVAPQVFVRVRAIPAALDRKRRQFTMSCPRYSGSISREEGARPPSRNISASRRRWTRETAATRWAAHRGETALPKFRSLARLG
jgi:hypothetical protein